jgi:hypothetical protein
MTDAQVFDQVLKATEEATGKPVLVQPDANLGVHATIRIARGDLPAHVLVYRPEFEHQKAYLASFQCGFLIRLYHTRADHRFDLAAAHTGLAEVERRVQEHFRRRRQNIPTSAARQLSQQIY